MKCEERKQILTLIVLSFSYGTADHKNKKKKNEIVGHTTSRDSYLEMKSFHWLQLHKKEPIEGPVINVLEASIITTRLRQLI